ncbi:MAG: DUF3791 domain-containing protein [Ruminococcus sp.]|jgi:hypothetical protein
MLDNTKITNTDELEFAVFCIENIVIKLGKNAEEIYLVLTERSDILSSYIIPEYEILLYLLPVFIHSCSSKYLE